MKAARVFESDKRPFVMTTIRPTFLIMVATLAIPALSLAQGKVLNSVCSDAGSEGKVAVLTICITEQGMRSGVQKELYIRLYADGHGEYEVTTPTPAGAVETG